MKDYSNFKELTNQEIIAYVLFMVIMSEIYAMGIPPNEAPSYFYETLQTYVSTIFNKIDLANDKHFLTKSICILEQNLEKLKTHAFIDSATKKVQKKCKDAMNN